MLLFSAVQLKPWHLPNSPTRCSKGWRKSRSVARSELTRWASSQPGAEGLWAFWASGWVCHLGMVEGP